MVRPGHIARSTGGMQFQGKAAAPLSEREQHVLRERLMERATKEIPDNGLGGPLFRVVLCFAIAISFGAGVWRAAEEQVAYEFFAAWLLEIALSAENLFAIFMIFRYFKVPLQFQETVLWWGLLGAVVMRGGMIIAGGVAILLLKELMLAYAAVIIYSGFRLIGAPPIGSGMSDEEMSNNTIIKLVQYVIPVTDYYDGQKFLSTKPDGSIAATPLLVVLLAVSTPHTQICLCNNFRVSPETCSSAGIIGQVSIWYNVNFRFASRAIVSYMGIAQCVWEEPCTAVHVCFVSCEHYMLP
mmetsp:Transcript_20282/g.38580  ORF Transcript_20282/g.38580 Transcript_20282/m.38580 type:complete len:297 (-) Transcript_20282:1490-2380(-)|eukprot:CAMPEP_0114227702 /NCGR_PEP_ID=MMETSP0058-20121206/1932_1 /TAXON_ID=36894 /ORGANISM="Pyramimonas parkeae, CCMP726" /LENGTH=296 /DNA_ID=CAMNT_0001338563 /DNA_START=141 /DNA_END=1031 /DNA_ORIENTATION=+